MCAPQPHSYTSTPTPIPTHPPATINREQARKQRYEKKAEVKQQVLETKRRDKEAKKQPSGSRTAVAAQPQQSGADEAARALAVRSRSPCPRSIFHRASDHLL